MAPSTDRRLSSVAVLLALVAALSIIAMLGVSRASASERTNYCGQILAGWAACSGAPRTFVKLEGVGDLHSVCIFYFEGGVESSQMCSGSAGEPVVWLTGEHYGKPAIGNDSVETNFVHGYAYKP